eukprot:GILJ01001808.1.p1 GENE.GILJ01001808.1~~GILJ01001808.1.p1  ORF type:complete len:449 (-),score=62.99 GILJ01001808.1:160-1506(-)
MEQAMDYLSLPNDAKKPLLSASGSQHSSKINSVDAQNFITPRDEYNIAYLSFLLLGAGFLFPWNAVITAGDYFQNKYYKDILTQFTVAYMCPNLFGLIFVVLFGPRFSFFSRIVSGFTIFLVALFTIPFIDSAIGCMVLVCILGFSDAIVQGSIYGLAGQFNSRYIGAVMAGNGVAGLVVSCLRLLTKGIFISNETDGPRYSAYLYFAIAAFVNFLCIVVYWFVLDRSPLTKHYLSKSSQTRVKYITESFTNQTPEELIEQARLNETPKTDTWTLAKGVLRGIVTLYKQVNLLAWTVGFNFLVSLALFPGITYLMKSETDLGDWYALLLVTEFNLFDLIGRTAPKWDSLIFFTEKNVWIPVLLRVAFFPLFWFALPGSKFFESDVWMYLFMGVFSLTNGYFGTLAMMFGPNRVANKDKETAGTVMVFFLTAGLTLGVVSGMFLSKAAQ